MIQCSKCGKYPLQYKMAGEKYYCHFPGDSPPFSCMPKKEKEKGEEMNIVQPYARMIENINFLDGVILLFQHDSGIKLLKLCEWAGRVSHRSEDKITEDSYDKFIRSIVLQHGDFSIIEHASVTVEAVVDRGITHEWVRHRLGAYTQESTRFVNYTKNLKCVFIKPELAGDSLELWADTIAKCEQSYKILVSRGVSPQIARSVLPNALASKLIVTYNLRMWRHFFLMRTSKETHPQMRQVTIPLLKEFQEKIPILYEDIIPEERQAENLRKMR